MIIEREFPTGIEARPETPLVLLIDSSPFTNLRANTIFRYSQGQFRIKPVTAPTELKAIIAKTQPQLVLLNPAATELSIEGLREITTLPYALVENTTSGLTQKHITLIHEGAEGIIFIDPMSTDPEEIASNLISILRRTKAQPSSSQVIKAKNITIDLDASLVTRGRQILNLTPIELEILKLFAQNPDQLLSHAEIISSIFSIEFISKSQLLRTHIFRLRKKIGKDIIETVKDKGYVLKTKDTKSS